MDPTTNQSTVNIVDVSEELSEKALKRTAEVLRKIDGVRRTLELPIEQLPLVIEIYNNSVSSLIAETRRKEQAAELAMRTSRLPVTMRSETRDFKPMRVPPGGPHAIYVRPQVSLFRLEDIAIHGDRAQWMVHDIKIGNRCQFGQNATPALGTEFGPGGILEKLRLETAYSMMDIVLVVEYVGPEAEGEVFEATLVGTAVE